MENADLHDVEFVWPYTGPTDVIVTGTFDQWSSSIHLAKGDAGFSGIVKIPWGEKIVYKYVVDGYWRCRDDRPSENDGTGNVNNVMHLPPRPVSPIITTTPIPAPDDLLVLTSTDVTVTSKESTIPSDGPVTEISLPPVDDALASATLHPVPVSSPARESGSPSKAAPVLPIAILPVNDSTTVGSASPSNPPERQSEAAALPEPPEPNAKDTTQGADSPSTHTPVQFSKFELDTSTSAPDPAPVEPSKPETEPPAEPVPVEVGPETDGVNTSSAVADVPPEQPTQQADEQAPKNKVPITPSEPSAPPSADTSTTPTAPASKSRKKRQSLFGKLKDIFFDKDKTKGKKSKN